MADLRWTLADLEDIETLAGIDFADLQAELAAASMARQLRICAALIYVQQRKDDPTLTFDAVRQMTGPELIEKAQPILEAAADPAPLPG